MKKLILLLLFIPFVSLGQTGIYQSDGVLTVKVPTNFDIVWSNEVEIYLN